MKSQVSEPCYTKILVDNPTCKRRFHLGFEANTEPQEHVKVDCPHCGVTLFERFHHPQVTLVREENLIKSPTGLYEQVSRCHFLEQQK